jgi:hypothetical protein
MCCQTWVVLGDATGVKTSYLFSVSDFYPTDKNVIFEGGRFEREKNRIFLVTLLLHDHIILPKRTR